MTAEFDPYAKSYDAKVNESLAFMGLKVDYFTRVKADYLVDLLKLHFGQSENLDLLDVGCGVGNNHGLLVDRVGSISGTDVSAECLARASERNPQARYEYYDGSRLPYADASFDAAYTICVLHHVPPFQRAGFAAELKRVLKPGGLAVIFEHNPRNPLTRRVVSDCEFDKDAVLLRKAEAVGLLEGAGFRDGKARSILSVPSFGGASRRVDLALGRLWLGAQYFVQATA